MSEHKLEQELARVKQELDGATRVTVPWIQWCEELQDKVNKLEAENATLRKCAAEQDFDIMKLISKR